MFRSIINVYTYFVLLLLILFATPKLVTAQQGLTLRDLAPEELVTIMGESSSVAPSIKQLERSLAVAESVHRAELDKLYGLQSEVRVPVEAKNLGVGSGVQAQIKKQMGKTTLTINAGAIAGNQWNDEGFTLAPLLEISVTHPLIPLDNPRNKVDRALDESTYSFVLGRRSFERSLIEAYGELIQAQSEVRIVELKKELALINLTATQFRQQEGVASVITQYEAIRQVNLTENAYQEALLELEEAKHNLAFLSGLENIDYSGIQISEEIFNPIALSLPDLSEMVSEGHQSRGEVSVAKEKVRAAQEALSMANKALGLNGGINAGLELNPSSGNLKWDWEVGAVFNLPLVNKINREQVIQAQLLLEEAEASLEQLLTRVELEINEAYNRVIISQRALEVALDEYHHSLLLYDVVEEGVTKGLYPHNELLQTLLLVTQAENRVVYERYNVFIQLVHLWHTIGRDVAW